MVKMLCLLVLLLVVIASYAMAEDGFLIGNLNGPEEFTQKNFAQIAKDSFNMVIIDAKSPETNIKALDLCKENGLKGMVADSRIQLMKSNEDEFEGVYDQIIKDYSGHPAFWGYFLKDEPDSSMFIKLGDVNRYLLGKDPTHTGFVGLFPSSATAEQLGKPNYEHYVDEYLRMIRPKLLSYENPSLIKDGDSGQHFQNLEIIRRQGIKHKTPFSCTLTSLNDLRWQINTALAYGARGIMYSKVLINNLQDKQVTKINAELKQLGPVLMNLHSVAVYHTAPVPEGSKALPIDGLITKINGGEFAIGQFNSEDSSQYAMLVNRSSDNNAKAEIHFTQEVYLYQVDPSTGKERAVRTKAEYGATVWKTKFKPGERRLIRIDLKLDLPVNNWEDKLVFRPRVMLNPSNQFANIITDENGTQVYNEGMNMFLIAEQVQKYLQQDGRVDVFMTRSSQTQKTTLQEETKLTRSLNCDLLLALHSDATGTSEPGGGTWTFYWDDEGKKLGDSVNSHLIESIRSYYPEVLNRGVRTHWIRLWVIHEAGCPAALTEFLFHSNPKERELLKDFKCQDTMAKAVAQGILEYLGLK